jgi:hypothetical protein
MNYLIKYHLIKNGFILQMNSIFYFIPSLMNYIKLESLINYQHNDQQSCSERDLKHLMNLVGDFHGFHKEINLIIHKLFADLIFLNH